MTKKMRLLPLVAATFFMVAGGPYGLEDIIGEAGYGRALLLSEYRATPGGASASEHGGSVSVGCDGVDEQQEQRLDRFSVGLVVLT